MQEKLICHTCSSPCVAIQLLRILSFFSPVIICMKLFFSRSINRNTLNHWHWLFFPPYPELLWTSVSQLLYFSSSECRLPLAPPPLCQLHTRPFGPTPNPPACASLTSPTCFSSAGEMERLVFFCLFFFPLWIACDDFTPYLQTLNFSIALISFAARIDTARLGWV